MATHLARYSSAAFERIGHDHVDTVLSTYYQIVQLNQILRTQYEDQSDDRAMIFWHGTSGFDKQMNDWAIVSKHFVGYGSDFMINLIFIGSDSSDVSDDGAMMDAVMNSLSFNTH